MEAEKRKTSDGLPTRKSVILRCVLYKRKGLLSSVNSPKMNPAKDVQLSPTSEIEIGSGHAVTPVDMCLDEIFQFQTKLSQKKLVIIKAGDLGSPW